MPVGGGCARNIQQGKPNPRRGMPSPGHPPQLRCFLTTMAAVRLSSWSLPSSSSTAAPAPLPAPGSCPQKILRRADRLCFTGCSCRDTDFGWESEPCWPPAALQLQMEQALLGKHPFPAAGATGALLFWWFFFFAMMLQNSMADTSVLCAELNKVGSSSTVHLKR